MAEIATFPLEAAGFRLKASALLRASGAVDRRGVAVAAAGLLCAPARPWRSGGRDPAGLDDLGLVKLCIQAGLDIEPDGSVQRRGGALLPDLAPTPGLPGRPNDASYGGGSLQNLLLNWGLEKLDLKHRQAGDVIVFAARHPAVGLLVQRGDDGADVVAVATPGPGSQLRYGAALGLRAVGCFAWPVDQRPEDLAARRAARAAA